MPQEVAGGLEDKRTAWPAVTATLAESLRGKEMLLTLDNCEHLVEAAAGLVDVLLDSCSGLRVMATKKKKKKKKKSSHA